MSPPPSVTISSGTVTVSPKIATLTVSQTQQFTSTVPGGGAASWTVDGVAGGNAAVGTITAGGLYTAGTTVGTQTVVATSVADPSLSGSAVVAVTDLAGVYTYHNDLARDGANTREYALTPANVNTSAFGKLTSCTVDGAIYGQPLWVANLTVNGAKHNVVFVATRARQSVRARRRRRPLRTALVGEFDRHRSWRIGRRDHRTSQSVRTRRRRHCTGSGGDRHAGHRSRQRSSVCACRCRSTRRTPPIISVCTPLVLPPALRKPARP